MSQSLVLFVLHVCLLLLCILKKCSMFSRSLRDHRYLAIVHPLRPRMSRTTTINIIVLIWIAACLLSLPNYLSSSTYTENFNNGDIRGEHPGLFLSWLLIEKNVRFNCLSFPLQWYATWTGPMVHRPNRAWSTCKSMNDGCEQVFTRTNPMV